MKSKNKKLLDQKISRRFLFLFLIKGIAIGAISWRLFDLQLIENQKYKKLSDGNQFDYLIIPPERGRILDRQSRLLAGNMDGFSLVLKWNKKINVDVILKNTLSIISINKKDIKNFNLQIKKMKNNYPKEGLIFPKYFSQCQKIEYILKVIL